jgi:hypothetical protein
MGRAGKAPVQETPLSPSPAIAAPNMAISCAPASGATAATQMGDAVRARRTVDKDGEVLHFFSRERVDIVSVAMRSYSFQFAIAVKAIASIATTHNSP